MQPPPEVVVIRITKKGAETYAVYAAGELMADWPGAR